jgi:hypothetical protein
LKTYAAFERQLDLLCTTSRDTLHDHADLLAVAQAVAAGRAAGGHLPGGLNPGVARCAGWFLRVQRAADLELPGSDAAALDEHVQSSLRDPA